MNKINFMGFVVAERCNPNGDPVTDNMPRTRFDGRGEISSVALKRKIRDRLQDAGYDIFVQPLPSKDGCKSLQERAETFIGKAKKIKEEDFIQQACTKWIDVRAFGQVFAYTAKDGGVSISIKGPVSITQASSLEPVIVDALNITRVVNTNADAKKRSERFGARKWIIDHGVYQFFGGIYPSLARATGFDQQDALAIRDAMINMFNGDASNYRPDGAIVMHRLLWWEHAGAEGTVNPAKILHGVTVTPTETWPYYTVTVPEFAGLTLTDYEL